MLVTATGASWSPAGTERFWGRILGGSELQLRACGGRAVGLRGSWEAVAVIQGCFRHSHCSFPFFLLGRADHG